MLSTDFSPTEICGQVCFIELSFYVLCMNFENLFFYSCAIPRTQSSALDVNLDFVSVPFS